MAELRAGDLSGSSAFVCLPACHQGSHPLEQCDQGLPEDGEHQQHGHDQAGQDGAELRGPLPLLASAEEGNEIFWNSFLNMVSS
jgi:hypothetical protein